MDIGSSIKDFNYVMDITKLVGNDTDDLIICGAVSDGTEDLDGERVDIPSMEKAWNQYMKNPVIRLMHDPTIGAIGRVIPSFTGADGTVHKTGFFNGRPYIVAKISKAADVESIRTKIREGVFSGLSIGGKARRVMNGNIPTLMIKSLFEISVVDIPSNKNSLFSVIKSVCVGNNCPTTNQNIMEDTTMEKDEIVALIKGVMSEQIAASEVVALQKSYDTLKTDSEKVAGEFIELSKKYDALKASAEEDDGGDDGENIIKSMTDKIDALKLEVEGMKTTPIQKGEQGGTKPPEDKAIDITSAIISRHYGVT